eukprot:4857807-Amphidinium_carterae.1
MVLEEKWPAPTVKASCEPLLPKRADARQLGWPERWHKRESGGAKQLGEQNSSGVADVQGAAQDNAQSAGQLAPAQPIDTEGAEPSKVEQLKLFEQQLKVLGAWGPPEIKQTMQTAVDQLRADVRAATPAPSRLRGLQQGVQRRQDKLQKLADRVRVLHVEQQGLEGQMATRLEEVRRHFRARRTELSAQIEEAELQKEQVVDELKDLREQQTELLQ